jgi:6-pyruvoyltetrahydropterin/6-carboxytetrahydropterin synthase
MIICKTFTFDAGHRLMNYNGPCSNIHGHTYKLEVMIKGDLDLFTHMVIDFKDLKGIVNSIIAPLDHALLLNVVDNNFEEFCQSQDQRMFVFEGDPTAENIANYIYNRLRSQYVCRVRLWETPTSYAEVGDDIYK